jgi:hypothetical protein
MASQFSLSGAIPQTNKPTNPFANIGGGNFSGVLGQVPKQPAPITHPTSTPTTPTKAVTTTHPDGTIQKTEYAPTPTTEAKVGTALKNENAPAQQKAEQSISDNQGSFKGLLGQTAESARANEAIGQRGQQIASDYGKQIADVGTQTGLLSGGYRTTGTQPIGTGAASVVAQTGAARQQALAAGGQMELAGNAQALTGQQQQTSGLTSASEMAQPQFGVSYGTQVANPLTGTTSGTGGTNLDPTTQSNTFAKQIMSGGMTYDQAVSSMAYAGSAGKTMLDNAIISAGGNPLTLQSKGSANQSIVSNQAQTVAGYTSALQQGQNLQSQLTDLLTQFGLNPSDINKANQGLQVIAQNVSDPRYKLLQNYVNDIANTYAQILTPPGGTATDTTRGIASGMLDATMKGQGLITVMQGLDQQAKAKISGVTTALPSNQNSGGFSEGTKSSDGSLVYQGGKWIKA